MLLKKRKGDPQIARRIGLSQPAVSISVKRESGSQKKKALDYHLDSIKYFYGRPP